MNRTIWIWRIIAVIVILTCLVLMINLYSRLSTMSRDQPPPPIPVEQSATPSSGD